MNRVIKSKTNSILNNNFTRNIKVDIGAEQIELDYAYKTNNENIKIIKTFSFDYTNKGSKQAALLAKEWAYNFSKIKTKVHLEKTFQTDKDNIELATLIYLNNINKNVSVALQILKEEASTHEVRSEGEIIQFADKMVDELQLSID